MRAADTPPEAYSRLFFAIQPPQNREVQRSVELIEELLETSRYGEAAPLIDRVLSGPIDYLDAQGVSLRKRLLASLAETDPSGRRVVKSILEGAYQRELSEARTTDRLRNVVTRYPPDLFGVEALTALARSEESVGAYAGAAAAWAYAERIAQRSGRQADAERYTQASFASAYRSGGDVDEVHGEEQLLQRARKSSAQLRSPESWIGPAGDALRQARGGGAAPSGWRAWWASVEPFVTETERNPLTPTGGLIATQGTLLTPTPTGLIAFDADSGKRLWQAGVANATLRQGRLAAYERARGGIATDGRLAFVVEPTTEVDARRRAREQGLLFTGGRSRTLPPNALVAYDIAREGQLVWRWDGGGEEGLGKASILGPPAAVENRLYVLAEIEQSVCLVTLDAASGRRLASQPLILCERGFPPHAVTVGVTPTVSNDLVYCPTGRGAVVAYHPLLRRIEWIHYLRVDKDQASPRRRNVWNGLGRSGPNDSDAWKHCRAVLHNDRLVVVSPALATIEVLHATSGEPLWRSSVESAKLLLGVEEDRVVTLEQSAVVARDLETGESVWRAGLPADESAAGEALWLEQGCLLPLASGALARVVDGELERIPLGLNPLERPDRLGDLIFHRGAVYSRSHGTIACYRQPEGGNDAAESAQRWREALQENPGDTQIAERLAAALLREDNADPTIAEELERLVSGPKGEAYARFFQIEAARSAGDRARVATLSGSLLNARAAAETIRIEPDLDVCAGRLAEDRLERFSTPITDSLSNATERTPSPWSSKHLSVTEKPLPRNKGVRSMSSRRREPAVTSLPLSLTNPSGSRDGVADWLVEYRNGEPTRLIGHNRWGERVFLANAPSESSARGRRSQQAVGLPTDALYSDWIALRMDDGYAVYRHAVSDPDSEADIAWTNGSRSQGGFNGRPTPSSPEQLYAAGPWGFISISEGRVICRDLSTGRVQWRRRLAASREETPRLLVSRDELLISGSNNLGVRLSAATGELRAEPWAHPPVKEWKTACVSPGGVTHLLIERRGSGGRAFRLVPVDDPDTALWSASCDSQTHTAAHPNGLFALLDQESRLTLIDTKRAEERFSVTLPGKDERPVRELRLMIESGRLYVEVDRTNPMIDRAVGVSALAGGQLLTGELHCLDLQTGEALWPGPAEIEALSRLPTPLRDAPALLYGRRTAPESESSNAEGRLSLVVLDPQTGGTLYRNHRIPAGEASDPSTRFRVQGEAGGELLIRLGRLWLSLRPTDRPAPPRPPMLARVEDPASSEPKDVGRSVERLINSFWDDR